MALHSHFYYKLQEHFELTAGPSKWLILFDYLLFPFCRGQIYHMLMNLVAAKGQRADGLPGGPWRAKLGDCADQPASGSRLGHEPEEHSPLHILKVPFLPKSKEMLYPLVMQPKSFQQLAQWFTYPTQQTGAFLSLLVPSSRACPA